MIVSVLCYFIDTACKSLIKSVSISSKLKLNLLTFLSKKISLKTTYLLLLRLFDFLVFLVFAVFIDNLVYNKKQK